MCHNIFQAAASLDVTNIHSSVVIFVILFNVNVAKDDIVFVANTTQDITAPNVHAVQITNVIHVNAVLNVIYQ